jgi:hypothetical protein
LTRDYFEMSDAILFLTHEWRPVHGLKFRRLLKEAKGAGDVFALLQTRSGAAPLSTSDPDLERNVHTFDAERLPGELGYDYLFDGEFKGSPHYPVLWFARTHPYRRYWLIENDVEFTGNWGELIAAVDRGDPDFVACHFCNASERTDSTLWRHQRPSDADSAWANEPQNCVKCFCPIYCISQDAISLIDAAYRAGWRGHPETTFATLLSHHQRKIFDFLDFGVFYKGVEQDPLFEVDALSTLRWRPPVSMIEFEQRREGGMLFHPIKDDWYFDGEKAVVIGESTPSGQTLPIAKDLS